MLSEVHGRLRGDCFVRTRLTRWPRASFRVEIWDGIDIVAVHDELMSVSCISGVIERSCM